MVHQLIFTLRPDMPVKRDLGWLSSSEDEGCAALHRLFSMPPIQ